MLGHKVFQIAREHFPGTFCTLRENSLPASLSRVELLAGNDVVFCVDAAHPSSFTPILRALRPEYILNCIGVIKQRRESAQPAVTIAINSLLPHLLADLASEWGGRLIHFSTDCVFSGKRGSYEETDLSDAEDLYGKSKYLGEVSAANALTLRTSIIGRELENHRSLLDWLLSQKGKRIQGYRRVMYSGVTTNHLARLVVDLLEGKNRTLCGLYQVSSSPISKYDLLCLANAAFRLDVKIDPDDSEASDRTMKCEKLHTAIGYKSPPWPELIHELANDSTPYERWLVQ